MPRNFFTIWLLAVAVSHSAARSESYICSGEAIDLKRNRPVTGACIEFPDIADWILTDTSGEFPISLTGDSQRVVIKALDLKTLDTTIHVGDYGRLVFYLSPDSNHYNCLFSSKCDTLKSMEYGKRITEKSIMTGDVWFSDIGLKRSAKSLPHPALSFDSSTGLPLEKNYLRDLSFGVAADRFYPANYDIWHASRYYYSCRVITDEFVQSGSKVRLMEYLSKFGPPDTLRHLLQKSLTNLRPYFAFRNTRDIVRISPDDTNWHTSPLSVYAIGRKGDTILISKREVVKKITIPDHFSDDDINLLWTVWGMDLVVVRIRGSFATLDLRNATWTYKEGRGW